MQLIRENTRLEAEQLVCAGERVMRANTVVLGSATVAVPAEKSERRWEVVLDDPAIEVPSLNSPSLNPSMFSAVVLHMI
jgi:hypothetical protein